MFAVVSDFDGNNKERIDLEKFTKHTSLWLALSYSVLKLQALKLDSRKRIFLVFDEDEHKLLASLGKRLGSEDRQKHLLEKKLRVFCDY